MIKNIPGFNNYLATTDGLILHKSTLIPVNTRLDKDGYPSINSVRYDGFDVSNVNKCLRGRSKTYRGYEWRYLW